MIAVVVAAAAGVAADVAADVVAGMAAGVAAGAVTVILLPPVVKVRQASAIRCGSPPTIGTPVFAALSCAHDTPPLHDAAAAHRSTRLPLLYPPVGPSPPLPLLRRPPPMPPSMLSLSMMELLSLIMLLMMGGGGHMETR